MISSGTAVDRHICTVLETLSKQQCSMLHVKMIGGLEDLKALSHLIKD